MIRREASSLIVAGHSHVGALFGGSTAGEIFLQPVEGNEKILGLHGPFPRTDDYWRILAENAAGHSIVLLWQGNEQNAFFLVEQPPALDFVSRRVTWLPIAGDAVIVPEALIRARLSCFLDPLHEVLCLLKEQTDCRIAVVGPPPPKEDNEYLRSVLASEFIYTQHREGATVDDVELCSPTLRLKVWHVVQELYEEQAKNDEVEFIPVPPLALDKGGFLKQEFWGPDLTHANRDYGSLMIDYLSLKLLGLP